MKTQNYSFTVCLTHDVDRIRKTYQYITHDLAKGQIKRVILAHRERWPYWNFDIIMKIERGYGVRSTFFFLNETIKPKLLRPKSWILAFGRYQLEEPKVAEVIRQLDKGGWEIGLHGSYNSYCNQILMKNEKQCLEATLGKTVSGIRQHHLNLSIPETWVIQKAVGFMYDATFGPKQGIGYLEDRYTPFIHKESQLVIIPLVLMDGNLFKKAENSFEKAWKLVNNLLDLSERKSACLTILWHQRVFNKNEFPGYLDIYLKIISECKRRGARFMTCKQASEEYNINIQGV